MVCNNLLQWSTGNLQHFVAGLFQALVAGPRARDRLGDVRDLAALAGGGVRPHINHVAGQFVRVMIEQHPRRRAEDGRELSQPLGGKLCASPF
jgi:hypothetical protein